jgi:NADH-quinone oxidoreductase subunit G
MPKIILDAVEYEVEAGQNLIQAAASVGVTIPHYCYHPGLSVSGNCRMCLVEVKGPRGVMPQIACSTPVSEGLEVITASDSVKKMRQGVMEFLLLNHPIDCPICDQAGECGLQDYYMEYGLYTNRSTVPKVKKKKVVDVGPLVMLDQERCILCSRCVRFCDEVTHSNELVIAGRGEKCRIETFPGKQLDNPYSANVVDICPVGALTSKDFRFKKRVWFLKSAQSICTGCARGCNVYLDHDQGQVYRYRPRTNPDVNAWWLCDAGRLSYKALQQNRLTGALKQGLSQPLELVRQQASAALSQILKEHGSGAVAGVASAHASLEDNFALQYLLTQATGQPLLWGPGFEPPAPADDFLRCSDPAPNTAGLQLLGINTEAQGLRDALASGQIKALIVLENSCDNAEISALLNQHRPLLIYLGSHHNALAEQAEFVLPITSHAEQYASYVNVEQRLQKVFRALNPAPEQQPGWQALAAVFAQANAFPELEDLWVQLSKAVPELKGLSWYDIPESGLSLKPSAPAQSTEELVSAHD